MFKNMDSLLIVWNDVHATGISIIDEQHRGIVSTINSLFYMIRSKQAQHILVPTILMMEQYTKIHFFTEEKLLESSGYPGFKEHKKLHDKLISQMITVSRESLRNIDPDSFLSFLKHWWINHINKNDRDYVEHIRQYLLNNPANKPHETAPDVQRRSNPKR